MVACAVGRSPFFGELAHRAAPVQVDDAFANLLAEDTGWVMGEESVRVAVTL